MKASKKMPEVDVERIRADLWVLRRHWHSCNLHSITAPALYSTFPLSWEPPHTLAFPVTMCTLKVQLRAPNSSLYQNNVNSEKHLATVDKTEVDPLAKSDQQSQASQRISRLSLHVSVGVSRSRYRHTERLCLIFNLYGVSVLAKKRCTFNTHSNLSALALKQMTGPRSASSATLIEWNSTQLMNVLDRKCQNLWLFKSFPPLSASPQFETVNQPLYLFYRVCRCFLLNKYAIILQFIFCVFLLT